MAITFKADEELTRRQHAVVAEYREEHRKKRVLMRTSYEKRFAAFVKDVAWQDPWRKPLVGRSSWYRLGHGAGAEFQLKWVREYFLLHEDQPCVMRGSIYAME